MSTSDWAKTELGIVDLGDERLNQRLLKISQDLLDSPRSPINQACGEWSETKAAYRFFQNDNVDYQDIVQAHAQMTRKRAEQEKVVLAVQDTTYYNYTNHPKTQGLGLLSRFKGKHKDDILTKGLIMHTTLAITPDGLPLGVLDQNIVSRKELPPEKVKLKKKSHNIALPIEEKESIRWLDSMAKTVSVFASQDQRLVTIADREADIYDLYLLAERKNTHFVIRASHDRKVNKSAIHSEMSGEYLSDVMKKKKRIGRIQIEVPKKENQPRRTANCHIKISKINMLPSRHYKGSKKGNLNLGIYAIQISEIKTPVHATIIQWMLLTNIPVSTYAEAVEKIKWYCLRWRIEVYFKVIKSGFKVEEYRLETADRLIRYLAVVSIVAWRVYWLTLVSRNAPNAPALLCFSQLEWKVLFVKFTPNAPLPKHPPDMAQVIIWIARLGGFLARKSDGLPGNTHVWRGLKTLASMTEGARLSQNICG